jgi:glycosyltransferase involved in cell wall biosynthesis
MKIVLIVINSLDIGGAEKFLLRLFLHMPENKILIRLYPLNFNGSLLNSFKKLPIDLIDTRNYSIMKHLLELKKLIIESSIVFSFLYKSDLIVIITKLLFNLKTIIIWNLRHSKTSFLGNKLLTFINIRINSFFSRYADGITYNSEAAFLSHQNIGYTFKKHYFLPNGFTINSKTTASTPYTNTTPLIIGNLSRLDFHKNHDFLIESFSNFLKNTSIDIYLLLVGRGVLSHKITHLISKFDLEKKVIRLDQITDTSFFFEIIDVYVSTSRSESFSNSIAEAIFMDKKVLVSNVGDNKKYFSTLSVYENLDSNDFDSKLRYLIANLNNFVDYSLFKKMFSINNTINVFLEIIASMTKI